MGALLEFENQTGLTVNYDKTTVYRLGSIRFTNAKFYSSRKIHWTHDPVNVLGYWVAYDKEKAYKLNFEKLIEKANNITKMWYHRGLSLMGKILVLNALIASLFPYRMTVADRLPQEFFQKMKKIFKQFLWEGKTPKVKWEVLTALKEEGGLGLVDLEKKEAALKLAFVFNTKDVIDIRNLANELLGNQLGELFWELNLRPEDANYAATGSGYWNDCSLLARQYCMTAPLGAYEVKNQVIWYNSNIKSWE